MKSGEVKIHWNYYLAIEEDFERLSRYIEVCEPNYKVYSTQLAHLLFASSSEVDAVAKLLCKLIRPNKNAKNICDYKEILVGTIPDLTNTEVLAIRHGLSFKPWAQWSCKKRPDWWRSYNNVKHKRDAYFNQATLQNALHALGALLIMVFHYYKRALASDHEQVLSSVSTMSKLSPQSSFLMLPSDYYHEW